MPVIKQNSNSHVFSTKIAPTAKSVLLIEQGKHLNSNFFIDSVNIYLLFL